MNRADQPYRETEALRERRSRLSQANRRISGSLDFDQVLQGVLGSARSRHEDAFVGGSKPPGRSHPGTTMPGPSGRCGLCRSHTAGP